jgi:ABC-type glycerol-3-phosphate transport system substrate-binding protein
MVSLSTTGATAIASAQTKSVTLTLFRPTTNYPYNWQISDFEKAYPDIHISVEQVPFGNFYAKTSVLADSSNPPDLYTVDQPTISNLAVAKAILPLNSYLSTSYVDSLTSAARADLSYDGKIYSPGAIDTSLALYYNATMLDKLGIHPPTSLAHTWTWPQALKVMEACQQGPASDPTVWGLSPSDEGNGTPGFDYYSVLFLRSEGNPKAPVGSPSYNTYWGIASNGSTVNGYINTPGAMAGAEFYQSMFEGKTRVTPLSGNPNAFIDGTACFEEEASNFIDSIVQAHVKFKWGVTPLPYLTSPIVHSGSLTIAIGAKTTHVAQALDFVKFLATNSQQEQMLPQDGYLPVVGSLYKTIPELSSYPWDIFVDQLRAYGEPRPKTPHYVQFSTLFTNTMRDIADGVNVKTALASFVAQMDPILTSAPGSL